MTALFKKKINFLILKVFIVLSAYAFIAYKLYNSKEIPQFLLGNFTFNRTKVGLIIIVFILMIINWLLEAVKWKVLVKKIKKINIAHSLYSVIAGISVGIFTPNRLGEFAGRPYFLDKSKMIPGFFAAVVGSLSQSFITILIGILSINLYLLGNQNNLFISRTYIYLILTFSVLLIIFIGYAYFNPVFLLKLKRKFRIFKKKEEELHFLASYKLRELLNILFFSFSRYIVFFMQFYLLLLFFNIEITVYYAFIAIGLIYLFLLVIPGFALSEIGVRGSLAIFFLGMFSNDYTAILFATISLWIINLALPAIWGTFIVMYEKFK
ncbi:MAG: lysylphosphatidylglycerol synthase domain-containing protein [Bacteroidota bacterium]